MRSIKPNDSDKETMKMEKWGIQGLGSTSDQMEVKEWGGKGQKEGSCSECVGSYAPIIGVSP